MKIRWRTVKANCCRFIPSYCFTNGRFTAEQQNGQGTVAIWKYDYLITYFSFMIQVSPAVLTTLPLEDAGLLGCETAPSGTIRQICPDLLPRSCNQYRFYISRFMAGPYDYLYWTNNSNHFPIGPEGCKLEVDAKFLHQTQIS